MSLLCLSKNNLILIVLVLLLIFSLWRLRKNYKNNASNENFTNSKIVLYYTDWCGYSKRFQPVWESLVQYAKDNKLSNLEIEKVDCVANKERCDKATIQGYPTVILEKDGKNIELDGKYPRTLDGLIKFLKDSKVTN